MFFNYYFCVYIGYYNVTVSIYFGKKGWMEAEKSDMTLLLPSIVFIRYSFTCCCLHFPFIYFLLLCPFIVKGNFLSRQLQP